MDELAEIRHELQILERKLDVIAEKYRARLAAQKESVSRAEVDRAIRVLLDAAKETE